MPIFVGEYEAIQQCIGTTEDCTIACQDRYPTCMNLPDGNNQYPGQTQKYIVCANGRTMDRLLCAEGTYDGVAKACLVKFDPCK